METNKLFSYRKEALDAIQELANERGVVYGEVLMDFRRGDISPYHEGKEGMLINLLLLDHRIWHLGAFELVDGQDVYRYAYISL